MTSEHQDIMLRRDGHVSSLGIDRYLYEDLTAPQRAVTEAHLAGCDVCSARIAEAREADAVTVLPPMPNMADPVDARIIPIWRRSSVGAAAMLALAASLIIVLWYQPPTPDAPGPMVNHMVRKGEGFTMHVLVDDGAGGRVLTSGDSVRPGDRLGFQIHPERVGYVMIVGMDKSNEPYRCFPQTDTAAAPVEATDEPYPLDEAIELDGVPGTERIVGILCPMPFDFNALSEKMRTTAPGTVPIAGCSTEEVVVVKSEVPR